MVWYEGNRLWCYTTHVRILALSLSTDLTYYSLGTTIPSIVNVTFLVLDRVSIVHGI